MKSKAFRIAVDIILIILGIVFLVFGIKDAIKDFSKSDVEDNIKFSKSYTSVPTDNIYKYIESLAALSDNAIVLVANPKDPWSQVLAYHLNEILRSKYETIYYLEEETTDNVPKIVVVKDSEKKTYEKKELVDENYKEAPIDYWTKEKVEELSKILE